MAMQERRERVRMERERLIIDAARRLAEAEGWEAVTTRRLAEQIEYSQPVLYSHFKGKDAIMAAVAVEGFAELAGQLRAARTPRADQTRPVTDQTGPVTDQIGPVADQAGPAADPRAVLAAVAAAYAHFAETRPVLYEAMFTGVVDLAFGSSQTPAALQEAFGELREAVRPLVDGDDVDTGTEVLWAGLHGLMTLMQGGRLPREGHERRLALLTHRFGA